MAYISIEVRTVLAEIGTIDGSNGITIGLNGALNWRTSVRDKANNEIGSAPWEVQVVPEDRIAEHAKDLGAVGICSYHERVDDPEYGSPAVFSAYVGLPQQSISDLWTAWNAGKTISSITLEIDDLEYGWEPDGSGKVWDTEIKHRTVRTARILVKDSQAPEEDGEDITEPSTPDAPTKRDMQQIGDQLKSIEKAAHYIVAAVVFVAIIVAFR